MKLFVISVAFGVLLFGGNGKVEALSITFEFGGTVTSILDEPNLLDDTIKINDRFHGSITYDLDNPGWRNFPIQAQYHYYSLPNGISATFSNMHFQWIPSPTSGSFMVEIFNDLSRRDVINFTGHRPQFPISIPDTAEKSMWIQLINNSGTAISSISLPVDINLADWDEHRFGIQGRTDNWQYTETLHDAPSWFRIDWTFGIQKEV